MTALTSKCTVSAPILNKPFAEFRSLSATFATPCTYCGGQARDSRDQQDASNPVSGTVWSVATQPSTVLNLGLLQPGGDVGLPENCSWQRTQLLLLERLGHCNDARLSLAGWSSSWTCGWRAHCSLSRRCARCFVLAADRTFPQHDAAEFTQTLHCGLGLENNVWAA